MDSKFRLQRKGFKWKNILKNINVFIYLYFCEISLVSLVGFFVTKGGGGHEAT